MTTATLSPTLDRTLPAPNPPARQPLVDAFRAEVVRLMGLPGVGAILDAGQFSWFVGQEAQYRVTQHAQFIEIGRCVGLHLEDKRVFRVAITQAAFECELYAARKEARAKAAPIPPVAVTECKALVCLHDTPQQVWARFVERKRLEWLQSVPEPFGTRQGVSYARPILF
jgi:hypothetical protein